jgi:hypothetical protein
MFVYKTQDDNISHYPLLDIYLCVSMATRPYLAVINTF